VISITRVRVTGFSRRYLDVDWEIAPTNDDLQEWEFYVERSEAEAGPFLEIAGPLVDRYYVRDNTAPQVALNRLLFYRVRAVNKSRRYEFYSDVVDREGREDLIAAEIGSLETMLFEEHVGTLTWLFVRRTFGQRCPQCWDDVLGKKTSDQCPTCFGTGFSGGYHYPVEFHAQIDKAPRVTQSSTQLSHQQMTCGFRCPGSPRVSPDDLVIDFRNRRYRVVSVAPTSRLGVEVRQEGQLLELQPGSIEDAVELKVEARALALAAYRNFTNPHSPEEAGGDATDAEIDNLLGRYGYRR